MPGEVSPATRLVVLRRDDYRCARCARPVAEDAHVHHRILRSRGGGHTPDNLVTLCPVCHGLVHAKVATATRYGFIVASWAALAETPIRTWRGEMILRPDGGYDPWP